MDHLIGQRFSLISKSEIRYVGTLHEINPEQSTISLEDVYSFGTEDRNPTKFIPPSKDKYDYIVFRGSDVKDIKVAEDQKENQQPSPPTVPNDPAILNSSRPNQAGPPQDHRQSPYPPPSYPPQPQFGTFPPPNHFAPGYGPLPGPFGGPVPQFYGPPRGYYGGPPQGFPPPPGQYPQQPPVPIGPPTNRAPPPPAQSTPSKQTSELPDNKAPSTKPPKQDHAPPASIPTTAAPSLATTAPAQPSQPAKPQKEQVPPAKNGKVAPAVPFTVNQKSFIPPPTNDGPLSSTNATKTASQPLNPPQPSLEDAARQAKAAVAEAMAKLNPQAAQTKPVPTTAAIEALTQKVGELNTGATPGRGRGGPRAGRGNRNAPQNQQRKIEIPQADYDFETANAKFNKEDLVKEAIASGSPIGETPESSAVGEGAESGQARKDSIPASQSAYNKSTSFFDNISSEAREREESAGRFNGRAQRGQEFKKNIETFGQGNVDGGFRGGFRGRGRGRGYGRGYNRGYGGGYRGRGQADEHASAPTPTA